MQGLGGVEQLYQKYLPPVLKSLVQGYINVVSFSMDKEQAHLVYQCLCNIFLCHHESFVQHTHVLVNFFHHEEAGCQSCGLLFRSHLVVQFLPHQSTTNDFFQVLRAVLVSHLQSNHLLVQKQTHSCSVACQAIALKCAQYLPAAIVLNEVPVPKQFFASVHLAVHQLLVELHLSIGSKQFLRSQ